MEYLSNPATLFIVAAESAQILGYAIAAPGRLTWELDSIAVSPKTQGRGIATRLLRRICALLKKQGALKLSLMVRRSNSSAIGLYKKFGFQRIRLVHDYYEDGAPAWRMAFRL